MARQRKRSSDRGRGVSGEDGSRGGLLPAGGLLVAVLAVLVLAAVLQTDEDTTLLTAVGPEPSERAAVVEPSPAPPAEAPEEIGEDDVVREPSAAMPEAEPRPPETGLPEDLERRASEDYRRLARLRSRWTLQLALVCDPGNVRKLLERTGSPEGLYVVPADYAGRDCYRVCWGVYPSRDQAASGGLPPGLPASEIGNPVPQPVVVVVP